MPVDPQPCDGPGRPPQRPDAAEDAVDDPDDPDDGLARSIDGEDRAVPGFDREAVEAEAEALLGRAEGEVTEDGMTRILRRGEEEFAGTMDLRPGRMVLELDDDGSGTYVVTRVTVEVADGDPIVIE